MESHIQRERETDPGFSFSDASRVRAPLRVWVSIAGVLIAGVAAWVRTEMSRDIDAKRIDKLEREQIDMRTLVREVRDTTIRIEANTAAMQRQLDRGH